MSGWPDRVLIENFLEFARPARVRELLASEASVEPDPNASDAVKREQPWRRLLLLSTSQAKYINLSPLYTKAAAIFYY